MTRTTYEAAQRRKKVMEFIVAHKKQHDGNSPCIREIGDACEISSTSVVYWHLQCLEAKGLISLVPSSGRGTGKARYIEVIGGQWTFVARSD